MSSAGILRRGFRVRYPAVRYTGPILLQLQYFADHGRFASTSRPTTFGEYIKAWNIKQHLSPDPLYTLLADKIEVREFVRRRTTQDILSHVYWVGADAAEIPWDSLPVEYVVKTNHGSGSVIQVRGRVNRDQLARTVNTWLDQNYYWHGREYQYRGIPPRVFVEELVDDGYADGPRDYKFYCFSGQPRLIQVDDHRHGVNSFYNASWEHQVMGHRPDKPIVESERPWHLEEMLHIARSLSGSFEFVRVDLYDTPRGVRFGELTFTPTNGNIQFFPSEWNTTLMEPEAFSS